MSKACFMFGSREKNLSRLSFNPSLPGMFKDRQSAISEQPDQTSDDVHKRVRTTNPLTKAFAVCSPPQGMIEVTSDSTSISAVTHEQHAGIPEPQHDPEGASSLETDEDERIMSSPQHESLDRVRRSHFETTRVIERNRKILLHRLSTASTRGQLTLINLSGRGLRAGDAMLLKHVILENQQLAVLKLSYNELGDAGVAALSSGFIHDGVCHKSLSVLDLGFNNISDKGVAALCINALAKNEIIHTVYLSGNNIKEDGALALSGAILNGCRLACLHLVANPIGPAGLLSLARSIAEAEASSNAQASAAVTEAASSGDSHPPSTFERRRTLKDLYLGDICMTPHGFSSIPSMLLTNLTIRVLSLSHNAIDDQGMALLSQAVATNKGLPLEVLQLSFNEITCAGVECFMNAIWGSEFLRELRLDNNKIRDRGAQLAAVGLSSINLQLLDLGFNRITALGIKALMKSVSESLSVTTLALSGISLDQNSCKAVKYALAYNKSLMSIYLDNCHVGYASQRHVVAGIVSNRNPSLRVLTGFDLGAICVTLGLPQVLETWSNDQVLRFIGIMWDHEREKLPRQHISSPQIEQTRKRGRGEMRERCGEEQSAEDNDVAADLGPASPTAVVVVAKRALAIIGNTGGAALHTKPCERAIEETAPFVPANATLLERSESGTVHALPARQESIAEKPSQLIELWHKSERPSVEGDLALYVGSTGLTCTSKQKSQNLRWLRDHVGPLNEVARLPFNNADLWLLKQYFFSPVTDPAEPDSPLASSSDDQMDENVTITTKTRSEPARPSKTPQPSPHLSSMKPDPSTLGHMDRAISFQSLGQSALAAGVTSMASMKRQSWIMLEAEEKISSSDEQGRASKRAKSFKPRIAYFPRIQEVLEARGTKASKERALSLLRQLKFVENLFFPDRNIYLDSPSATPTSSDTPQPTPEDVEMIILDLL